MSRLRKLLGAATLLVLPVIAACGEDIMPPLSTGSIVGQVTIEGMGVDGVTVSLGNGASTATAGGGNYRFDSVEQGSYTVTISGFPADASFDATSALANIGDTGGTATVDFRGIYLRTASIIGVVTVENMGLSGVTVRLSGMADSETTTDDSGQYSFTGLRAGTYSVEISGFDSNDVSFSSTSGAATVGVGESKVVSFDGTSLRTAGIMGQVSVDGDGLGGVTVTLMGQGAEETSVTDAGGRYAFSRLRSGDYTVAISGYDTDDYEFTTTAKSVTIATDETANVPFDGTLLRTAGIAGRVSLDDGMGLDGVTVTLAGAAEATTETSNGGQYAFAGLTAGTYVLSIENPNETAYTFAADEMQKTVMLEDDQSAIVNFSGTHTRTASVSGMLFIDEVMQDRMYTEGEPSITAALAPWLTSLAEDDPAQMAVAALLAKASVKLRGPDLNEEQDIAIMPDGTFSTGAALMAGSYQVELPVNDDDVAAGLAAAGVMFVGESMVVNVEAGGSATVNFPFQITMQTVATGARMGGGGHFGAPVEGVKLALYARADGTDMLGEAETDEMGMASFTFARGDNTGPAGNDNIVFVRAVESGHPALVVSGNEYVEIAYASTARLYAADAEKEVATLVNIAVAFDFRVKSNETARDGDMGLEGWRTGVAMVGEYGEATPLAIAPDATDEDGKTSFAYAITDPANMLPATFTVMATEGDDEAQPDMGEMWEQGDALTYTHTGLDLPPGKDDDMLDLGPIRITFTTQAVYVGAHRELDDRTGYTDFIGFGDGDARPTGTAIDEIEVSLMVADSRGRLRPFEYDHDLDDETDDVEATATFDESGMVSFPHIPAATEITVVADAGSGMMIVPDDRASAEIDAFGDQLDDYPDGKIVGAFGDGSGARPDVWICPLWRLDHEDPNDNCSTFAYKWATGTVSGTVDRLQEGDEDVRIRLEPVNSNDDYAADLEDDLTVDHSEDGASYAFTGVADGRYRVILEAEPGSWRGDTVSVGGVIHDEDNDEDDYTGDVNGGNDLSATDLRGVIAGVIANDADGNGRLTGSESRAGVLVEIYHASGSTTEGFIAGDKILDENGDPVTATTNEDGVFSFTGLQMREGGNPKVYLLRVPETDLYKAVKNRTPGLKDDGDALITYDDVSYDIATPGTAEYFEDFVATQPPPQWDPHFGRLLNHRLNNFALLYKDGEVEGEVSDPGVRAAHQRAIVELHLCSRTNGRQDDLSTPGDQSVAPTRCTEYEGTVAEADVDADGAWTAEDLVEGVYEVVVDLPAGYVHVTENGSETSESTTNSTDGTNTLFSQQMVELVGSRADDHTETFHIKDRNAGADADLTSVEIDGDTCTPAANPTNATPQCGHSDDGSFSVVVTASTGATVRLSSSGTDATPSGPGTSSQAVTNGRATTVTLSRPGTRTYYVHIAAEDGYATNTATDAGFSIRRDADVRVKDVTISWNGDRIDLDREELNLDPDGETDPVTGATTLRITISEGDNRADVPTEALSLSATGMNTDFDAVTWAEFDLTAANPSCGTFGDTADTVTLPANAQGSPAQRDAVCFRITDSDGDTDDEDTNPNNTRDYILIVTRGG